MAFQSVEVMLGLPEGGSVRRLVLAVVFLLSWCLAAIAGEVLSKVE